MATFRIPIAMQPHPAALRHNSSPTLRRSLVFFVHHRSVLQQCHLPPGSPDQSRNSTRNPNSDYIARSRPYTPSIAIKDWFHINSEKKYNNRHHKIRNDDFNWSYKTRGTTQKFVSIHKSLFKTLDIMSKPYAYARIVKPARPTTVKSTFENQSEFGATTPSTSHSPVSPGTLRQINNTRVAPNTFETTSTPEVCELAELQQQTVQPAPGGTGTFGIDETASPVARSNISSLGIHPQNNEFLVSPSSTVMNKIPDVQTEKRSKTLQATTANVGKPSKLSPADLIASLRYYDRQRGTLPDEEPLSSEDVAVLESARTKLKSGLKSTSQYETTTEYSTKWLNFKRIGIAASSFVVGVYIFGVGTKLVSVQPESTAAVELLSAVQRSKPTRGRVD
ncbi:hypothetical protein TWF225_006346 [Orbilia oligospora]|nr:hypothetical protein TWF751_004914 [Orbilia oligospora]KAF3183204.1 hypothetical protein TWF225_006346 [Orbilia oligospora]KAF3235055.1 hypothetical protein TWF128_002157 [Orbilia oligospora]KAF3235056.1 hypothetical protein TWF128_002157 [Orbilia oligospora]KAF3285139.1 hypothetical protein TWF132_009536 [Orbilia oligospora]